MSKLIGKDPNQVPSNADLGSAAFASKKEFLLAKGAKLSAVNALIQKNAVDLIVYDTTLDPDGGAWRHRCQATSWYNENLNTPVRGKRREFPQVAVIILVDDDGLYIYDGDDPDLSLWMKFDYVSIASQTWYGFGSSLPDIKKGCISALNGQIAFGTAHSGNSSTGLTLIRFITDDFKRYWMQLGVYHGHSFFNIAERNTANSTNFYDGRPFEAEMYLVERNVRSVDLRVFDGAEIDPQTGVPYLTIAVGTDGGVSVIETKNDKIADFTFTNFANISDVSWIDDKHIMALTDSYQSNARFGKIFKYSSSDTSLGTGYQGNQTVHETFSFTTDRVLYDHDNSVVPFYTNGYMSGVDGGQIATTVGALRIYHDGTDTSPHSFVRSDNTTGMMIGETVIMPSNVEPVSYAQGNIVTNGDFSSGTTGWSITYGTISVTSGQMTITRSGGNGWTAYQEVATMPGVKYHVSAKIVGSNTNASMYVQTAVNGGGSSLGYSGQLSAGTTGVLETEFVASGTQAWIQFANDSDGLYIIVDDVQCTPSVTDLSYLYWPMHQHGYLERSQVNFDTELTCYENFSGANYIEQPYNSYLQPTPYSKNLMFSMWLWLPSGNPDTRAFWIGGDDPDGTGEGKGISVGTYGGKIRTHVFGTWNMGTAGEYAYKDSTWTHFALVVDTNGMVKEYANGKFVNYWSGGSAGWYSGQTGLRIGKGWRYPSTYTFAGGKVALFKMSFADPTPEEIDFLYQSEKDLFIPGAKCTLSGTSNAVRDISYDKKTGLSHIAVDGGYSVFDNLVRVDGDTRYTNRVSARNGYVIRNS